MLQKVALVASLGCALLLSGCEIDPDSSLKDISRPYASEYKCRKLQLGGEEMLSRFSEIKLSLTQNGAFVVTAEQESGAVDSYRGTYRISEEGERISFTVKESGEEKTFEFPYRKGKVGMEFLLRDKLLYAEFSAVE